MKTATVAITFLVSAVLCAQSQSISSPQAAVVADGEYIGLQPMANPSADEPKTAWFHENTLIIRNNAVILDMVPISVRHNKKSYSASDGGFLTYRGRFFQKDGKSFVALRLIHADYVMRIGGERQAYSEIKTCPVKLVDGSVEINGVRYKRTALDKTKHERLLDQLKTEPMEQEAKPPQ